MRNDNYFKRLDYHIQDVPAAPFSGIFFHTESKTAQYLPIEDFLKTCSAEQVAKIFNTEKSPREKNCGLGKRFTDEVMQSRTAVFTSKLKLIKLNTIRPPLILLLIQLRAIVIAVKL